MISGEGILFYSNLHIAKIGKVLLYISKNFSKGVQLVFQNYEKLLPTYLEKGDHNVDLKFRGN